MNIFKGTILFLIIFFGLVMGLYFIIEHSRKEHRLMWCYGEFDTPLCRTELEKRKEAAYLKETSAN